MSHSPLLDLDALEALAPALGYSCRRVNANQLDVTLAEDCVLAFCNMPEENDSLIGFEGTPRHTHPPFQFYGGPGRQLDVDALELLTAISSGDLIIASTYQEGVLTDRELVDQRDSWELLYLKPGQEYRFRRVAASG